MQTFSVKDNIVFAEPFNKLKYENIIDRAQLRQDLKILTGGDECEIGEKGINLSGGQKQRINIARAVYADKSIYLFDDPLSALDSNVGAKVFDEIISNDGLLKNKTRLFVTHRISLLKRVDHVIVMKGGRISEQGTYNELKQKGGDFADLVIQFLSEAYHEIDENEQSQLLEDIKDKDKLPPELERSRSFINSTASPTKQLTGKIDQSMKSIEASKGISSSVYQAANGSRKTERSNSILSRSSTQLEMDKKIEARQRKESLRMSMRTKENKDKGKLIEVERMEVGSVKKKVYWDYLSALGIGWYGLVIVCYIISHSFNVLSQLWLSKWSDDSIDPANFNNTALRNQRLIGYTVFGLSECVSLEFCF